MVQMKMGVGHAQGTKYRVARELEERFSRSPANHLRQQGVAAVAVQLLFTGDEIELSLTPQHHQDIFLGDHVVQAPARQGQQVPLIPQPARVIQEMPQGDRFAEIVDLGQVLS